MLDPFRGIKNELMDIIDSKQYFVIHAARQSGKTTLLKELSKNINAQGNYHALYCSLEALQDFNEPEKGIPEIVKKIADNIKNQSLPKGFAKNADYSYITGVLNSSLVEYCGSLDKPLIIFFDEADCLSNGTLITFLRQLRDGYVNRPDTPFAHSIALAGMRNIRDYKSHIRPDLETLGSASPFNIIKESFNLRNFTQEEVSELYSQHTAKTGQVFEPEAVSFSFDQTQGQPWLVNAIACECVDKITRKNYSAQITKNMTGIAIQNIILERKTHFDSLMERLREPRVRKIILPLVQGEESIDKQSDDFLYVKDLGLIKVDEKTKIVEPSNPIYAEIIVRGINLNVHDKFCAIQEYEAPRYLKEGIIDINSLLKDFQIFWRENSEIIWDTLQGEGLREYKEASPHLVLQAFLQRVINGGGRINREMALGKKRVDICLEWQGKKYPIEIKILRNAKTISNGLSQTFEYMEKCGSNDGWLVIFDRDTAKSWDDKIYIRSENYKNKLITIVGL